MRYRGETRPAIRRGSIREFFAGDPNLKGCWSLNGHAQDHSGNGYNGTVSGAVPHIGRFGRGYYFDGYDDYMQFPAALLPVFQAKSVGWTWMGWVYVDTTAAEADYILSAVDNGVGLYDEVRIIFRDTSLDYVYDDDTFGAVSVIINGDFRFRWKFLTMAVDASNIYGYLDGVLMGTADISGVADLVSLDTFEIGSRPNFYLGQYAAGSSVYMKGKICENGLFSRTLRPVEVTQYYQWAISSPRKYWYYSPAVAGVYMDSYFYRHLMAGGK